jgi:GMP synthase-like glutamine amidotransferase
MRIHYLQHAPFEDLGNIWIWASDKGHSITSTKLYLDEKLPSVDSSDWLIVMGGPMNVYDETKYPWLVKEKKFIGETIDSGKFVLGICLGGQLVADVLGGKVRRNNHKEIGWFHVMKTAEGSRYFKSFPGEFMAFHWHGDTFDVPPGAARLAESEGCVNQAFEYDKNVLALQFHLESSEASIGLLIENCRDDMTTGKYVQTSDEILQGKAHLKKINMYMSSLLNEIEKRTSTK